MINVTTIGGGSGSFQTLLALKKIENVNISAIVAMSDNGGSTGLLRTLYGILPPGDVRNCLVALSEESYIWSKIFSYRFDEKLSSHNLGNLILTALTDYYGSFEKALEEAHKILNVKHKVIPITYSCIDLKAEFEDGKTLIGEREIFDYCRTSKIRKIEIYSKEKNLFPNPKTIKAIRESDFIVIGPGSFYSSILSNVVFPEIADEIKTSNSIKIFILNIVNDLETKDFKLSDYIKNLEKHIHLDYIIVNSTIPNEKILFQYKKEGKEIPEIDIEDERIIFADLINSDNLLRHDPEKLSRLLEWLFLKHKRKI
ncbi:MAG: YvcK family protein [Candidatus Woesearchaeota archaeon]